MRLQLDPDDDEAETQMIRALADDVAPRLEREFRAWLRELFGSSMSEAEILDWERRLQTGNARFRDVLERALVDATDLGVTVGIDQLAQVGIGFDWTLVNTRARENARQYAGQLITQITDTTRNTVREAVARYINNGEPLSALIRDLQATGFSQRRARLIAATEVTGAFARANEEAYRESGVVETMEWRTATDEKVCPVCGRLDGQRAPMGQRFEGVYMPPAHPGCRCWIAPIVKSPQEIAAAAASAIAPSTPAVDPNNPYGYAAPEDVRAQMESLAFPDQKKIERLQREIAKTEKEYQTLYNQWRSQSDIISQRDPLLGDKLTKLEDKIAKRQAELDKVVLRSSQLTAQQEKKLREKILQLLEVEDPLGLSIAPGAFRPSDYQEATTAFGKLVDSRTTGGSRATMFIKFNQEPLGSRAYAAPRGEIHMPFLVKQSTIVHELGHVLEEASPDIFKRSIAWRNSRTQGDTLQQLTKITGDPFYAPHEVTKPDKFIDPYIGRQYIRATGDDYGTEVMSMGLQYMFENPLKFARDDPDMFDFVYKNARGMQ